MESQAPLRRIRPRGQIVSAFKGFEDDFDESKIVREESSAGIVSQLDSLPNASLDKNTVYLPISWDRSSADMR